MSASETLTNAFRAANVWFADPAPQNGQHAARAAIRAKARELAMAIIQHTPNCADQTAALRKVREAVATSDMAIICGGK